ncbi:hypothetical protein DV738_g1093, partial [Chaetothyriales sp. CBS 135597]
MASPQQSSHTTTTWAPRTPSPPPRGTRPPLSQMQHTLADVQLSTMSSTHVFGAENARALEDLRTAQLSLAQAWAKSQADETVDNDLDDDDADNAAVAQSSQNLEEETEMDIRRARKRKEANDRYFQQVNQGVLEVVSKLDDVAGAMRRVQKKSRDLWDHTGTDTDGSSDADESGDDQDSKSPAGIDHNSASDTRKKQWMTRGKPVAPQRPRTRAFAKLHGLSIKNVTLDDLNAATATAGSRRGPKGPTKSDAKQTRKKSAGEKPKSVPAQTSRLVGTAALRSKDQSPKGRHLPNTPQGGVSDTSTPQSDRPRQQTPRDVAAWLDIVSPGDPPISPPSRQISYSIASLPDIDDMESSSSAAASKSTTNDETTGTATKESTIKGTKITFMEHLEFRGIKDAPSDDPELEALDLEETIGNVPSHVEFAQFGSLLEVLDHFSHIFRTSIRDHSADNGLPTYYALKHQISRWRPDAQQYRRFPPMTPEEFDWDRGQCFNSSEADFHRTIMISVIDRFDLGGVFAFSCEEQWGVSNRFLIQPTRVKSRISQPKPDLALSFQRTAFTKDDDLLDYPVELAKCLHPGVRGRERWFPFVFIEAKKDDNSLRDAFEKALYAASQGLFNIYQWMRLEARLEEQFFEHVRVFTIVLNNEDITLRIHRVVKGDDGRLRYRFAVVSKIKGYNRFQACHLVKSVLVDYGLPHLHPILKDTYETVSKMEGLSETGTKRKQAATDIQPPLPPPPPPAPAAQATAEQGRRGLESESTGISFDADNLDLSASGSNPKPGTPPLPSSTPIMASYLSYITSTASSVSTSSWSGTFSSRIATFRKALTKGAEEDDPDNEDCSHVSNVLRAYYTEKGRTFPEWLPPDPKRPSAAAVASASQYSQYGQYGQLNNAYGTQSAPPSAHGRGGSGGRGALSDLWDSGPSATVAGTAAAPAPQSLRSARPSPQSLRSYDSSSSHAGRSELTTTYSQPGAGARPLPSQRVGSFQNTPAALGSRDRLRARLQGGSGDRGSGGRGSYSSASGQNELGGNPYASASESWANPDSSYQSNTNSSVPNPLLLAHAWIWNLQAAQEQDGFIARAKTGLVWANHGAAADIATVCHHQWALRLTVICSGLDIKICSVKICSGRISTSTAIEPQPTPAGCSTRILGYMIIVTRLVTSKSKGPNNLIKRRRLICREGDASRTKILGPEHTRCLPMPPKRSSGQQGREKGLDGDEDDVGASSFATSSTTLPTPSMSRQQSSTASSGPPASSSPPGQTSSSSHSSSHEPLPAHFTGDPKTISQNQKDQLIEWLRTHRVNTITELRRIEKIFAFLDSAEVTEPMISAWAHYVNSNNLLNELRGLTKRFPFSSECLDEAKQLVLAEPATVRSWNYCWLVLTKMERE